MNTFVLKKSFNASHQVLQQAKEAEAFELRLDTFEHLDHDEIKSLRESIAIPLIFTLRKASHGGYFKQSEEKRHQLIEELARLEPTYFDIECDTDPKFVQRLREENPGLQIISSYHNFDKTPEDLSFIFEGMQHFPAEIYKLATFAHSTLDSLRMLHFLKNLKSQGYSATCLCMGEEGKITRHLASKFGSEFHYLSLDEEGATAPGQLTFDELKKYPPVGAKTRIYGLIGDPVSKSVSHITHNTLFKEKGIDAIYLKMRVRPKEITPFLELAASLEIKGMSVTMPLKEDIIPNLYLLDEQALRCHAVNTLHLKSGKWEGFNTDSIGALNAVESELEVLGKNVAILGAGGTAKALTYEAMKRGANVTVFNRTLKKAEEVGEMFGCEAKALADFPNFAQEAGYDILINTTSVGMAPNTDDMPIPIEALLPKTVIFDVISNPRETRLLQEAKKKECVCIPGIEMFFMQAVEQFAIWFGDKIDREEAYNILKAVL